MTPVDQIKAELAAVRELMAATPEAEWDKDSACGGFLVRDVVGHLVASRRLPTPVVLAALARHGFRLDTAACALSKREGQRPRQELLDGLAFAAEHPRARGISRLQPVQAMFADVVTHHEDIRWGLGARRRMAAPLAHDVLDTAVQLRGLGSWGTAERAKGLSLHATDVGWRWGSGPLVSGTADALLLGLGGRTVAHGELSGEGLSRW